LDILTIANVAGLTLAAFELGNITAFLGIALGLGLVIFFHELGHFAVAKWCNVNVERFSIGFGPIIWSRQKGETEYALSAIPFGGYVKMLGQDDMDPGQMANEDVALNPRSYSAKSVPQRMAIISAGVIMNIFTGLLFFAVAFRLGVVMPPAKVGFVLTDSPAYVAGVESGDTITHINGKEINSFMDVTIGVTLSSGNIQLEGVRRTGETFDVNVIPNYMNGTRRTIGVGPEMGMTFRTPEELTIAAAAPGTAASRASEPFEHGDTIVSVNGEDVTEFADLAEILSRQRAHEVAIGVERKAGESKTVKTITVGPSNFRSLGVWMDIGLVTSIRNGSPAEMAGFKKDDKIIRVNDQTVGIDIDPLRLPDFFAKQYGTEVEVEVRRQESGGGDTTATLTVTPADRPGWTNRPGRPTEPLTVPAIGLAFPVIPRIVKVDKDSQAYKAGIRENQTVTKIELITDGEPVNGYYQDLFSKPSEEIVLEEAPENDKALKPINWGYAFWMMQLAPTRWVKITVTDGDTEHVYDLHKTEKEWVTDWFLPTRGLRLGMAEELQRGESFGEAFTMGIDYTKNTATQIYLTLRSLVMQELSPKELHGPIGIFQVGYQVAEQGIAKLLLFLGFLSINLAVLNFLPIPVLDGGHMVFLIWEGVTRRKPSEKVMIAATYLGMAFVLSLMMFVLYLDIFVHSVGG
jgi:regulator of sigma E protease